MYECLVGYAPFYADDTVTTCKKIVNWQRSLVFPPDQPISPEARSLITQVRCVEFLELLLFSNSVAAENAFCSLPATLHRLGVRSLCATAALGSTSTGSKRTLSLTAWHGMIRATRAGHRAGCQSCAMEIS